MAGPTNEEALLLLEDAGRTCYKSEYKSDGTIKDATAFVGRIIKRGHESVLEHVSWTLRFVTDRGVAHELVRHRIGVAFSQESTRYVDYTGNKTDGHCQFVIPPWCVGLQEGIFAKDQPLADLPTFEWLIAMTAAEGAYKSLRERRGWSPQQARSVLPNSTKTEIVVTANAREWRHIFRLRLSNAAHPQMREVMEPAYDILKKRCPSLFRNLKPRKRKTCTSTT